MRGVVLVALSIVVLWVVAGRGGARFVGWTGQCSVFLCASGDLQRIGLMRLLVVLPLVLSHCVGVRSLLCSLEIHLTESGTEVAFTATLSLSPLPQDNTFRMGDTDGIYRAICGGSAKTAFGDYQGTCMCHVRAQIVLVCVNLAFLTVCNSLHGS